MGKNNAELSSILPDHETLDHLLDIRIEKLKKGE